MNIAPHIAGHTRRWSLTVYEAKRGRRHFLTKFGLVIKRCKFTAFFVIRKILTLSKGLIY